MKGSYDMLWQAIIRPPRASYVVKDLGPFEQDFGDLVVVRTDMQIKTARGKTI